MAQPNRRDRPDEPHVAAQSYLGGDDLCPLADEQGTCYRRADLLLAAGREDELRAMVAGGHHCALVRLMELLVSQERVEDLRAMAVEVGGPAETTLMEYLYRRGDEEGLREAAGHLPGAKLQLARLLAERGRVDEALHLLAELETSPEHAPAARHHAARLRGGSAGEPGASA